MDNLTERLEHLAELQKKSLEPLQTLGGNAFVAFERMARKNYELMGDMVEYAVSQSKRSLEPGSPQAHYERQLAEARDFAERMGTRAAEYLALAEQMRDGVVAGNSKGVAPVAPSASRAETSATKTASAAPARRTAPKGPASAATTGAGRPASKKASSKKVATKKSAAKKVSAEKAALKKIATKKKSGPARKKSSSRKKSG